MFVGSKGSIKQRLGVDSQDDKLHDSLTSSSFDLEWSEQACNSLWTPHLQEDALFEPSTVGQGAQITPNQHLCKGTTTRLGNNEFIYHAGSAHQNIFWK